MRAELTFTIDFAEIDGDSRITAEIDIEQMRQAVHNILLNARQAMPQGGIIEVGAENVIFEADFFPLHTGRYVKISVRDHRWDSADDLPRIFDPYFTTKRNRKRSGSSPRSALLSPNMIVISRSNRCWVWKRRSPFTSQRARLRNCRNLRFVEELETGSGRILVMDDEEALRNLLTEILKRLGYEVEIRSRVRKQSSCTRKRKHQALVLTLCSSI